MKFLISINFSILFINLKEIKGLPKGNINDKCYTHKKAMRLHGDGIFMR
jgi:hypothetical protein